MRKLKLKPQHFYQPLMLERDYQYNFVIKHMSEKITLINIFLVCYSKSMYEHSMDMQEDKENTLITQNSFLWGYTQ